MKNRPVTIEQFEREWNKMWKKNLKDAGLPRKKRKNARSV